jgi:hypothetical protein
MLQAEGDCRLEEAELVAAIEAAALKAQTVEDLAFIDQLAQSIGQLDLAAGARLGAGEVSKNLGLGCLTTIVGVDGATDPASHPPARTAYRAETTSSTCTATRAHRSR